MAMTLTMRKMWLRPVGTRIVHISKRPHRCEVETLTMAIIAQVGQLVAPLCDNSQRVLEERNDNQESANSW